MAGDVWAAPDASARPFHQALDRAARAQGGRLLLEPRYRYLGQLDWGAAGSTPILGSVLGLNTDAAAGLAADKTYAAQVMAQAGLPVPEGVLVVSDVGRAELALKNAAAADALPPFEQTLRFAARVGYPVFVKPNRGSEGAGVTRADTAEQLQHDLSALGQKHSHMRVEAACPGADLRVLVLNGQARLAYARETATLVGDGQRDVAGLLTDFIADLAACHRGAKLSARDPRVARVLAERGLSLTSVLPHGMRLALLPGANLSTGGQMREESDRLPAATAALAVAAAQSLGLTWAGVDVLVPDPALGPEGATVLEVNSAPGLDFYLSSGPAAQARAAEVLSDAVAMLRP